MKLQRDDLTALARGYALLGSGGGGSTTMLELMLAGDGEWPIEVSPISALDPATPCLGVAFVGSTMLLGERLPGVDPFARLLSAVQRWIGHPVSAVCSLEGGGMNGLAPLTLAGSHVVVDADCTGRAVPGLDQMSLFVDRVPGLVFACDTGADGVALVEAHRAIDAERVVRSAIIQAGGVGCAVLGGFTVGDLREHAIGGHLAHALELGRAYLGAMIAPLPLLADALGAQLLAEGRIVSISSSTQDPHVNAVEISGLAGAVHRIVTRSPCSPTGSWWRPPRRSSSSSMRSHGRSSRSPNSASLVTSRSSPSPRRNGGTTSLSGVRKSCRPPTGSTIWTPRERVAAAGGAARPRRERRASTGGRAGGCGVGSGGGGIG